MSSELKSTTVDKAHKELLGQVSDTYQKTEGFPTWDILKAAAFGIKRVWDKVFMIDYLQDVDNLTGADLERFVYQRKGLKRKEATYSVGFVNIVRGEGIVSIGDVFSTSGGVESLLLLRTRRLRPVIKSLYRLSMLVVSVMRQQMLL